MQTSDFWHWFQTNASRLAELSTSRLVVDQIHEALSAIDLRLGVEVSNKSDDGIREVIISANGFRELFSLVEELVKAAPQIPGWTFIALKPARGFHFKYRQDASSLSPSEWSFQVMRDEHNKLGLRLLIPGKPAIIDSAVLHMIVETGIGEKASAEISHLEYTQLPEQFDGANWIGIDMLPEFLKWQRDRTGGR